MAEFKSSNDNAIEFAKIIKHKEIKSSFRKKATTSEVVKIKICFLKFLCDLKANLKPLSA